MKRYELIVFDWDGTLMDSAGAIVAALQAAARDIGVVAPSEARARHIIGLGLRDALASALPNLPEQHYLSLAESYRRHFMASDGQLQMFAGAPELLAELSGAGHLLAVATGKTRAGLARALATSGIGDLFVATRCADQCHSKPHPQMLQELMDELAVAPERTLMIGDTTHDLLMAKNAGVAALGVSYGAHPRAELLAEAPLHCVDSVAEMARWLAAQA